MASAKVSTVIDAAQVRALGADGGAVFMEVQRIGNRVLNAARANCPVDQGALRASLTLQMEQRGTTLVAVVGTNLEYGLFVHEGTGIYAGRGMIVPKRGRYLRWPAKNNSGAGRRRYANGRTAAYVYARAVRGVKGRPFLTDALREAV
jgi:hypothetical protein